jgi:AcrR family transcriptional regulator
MSGIAAKLGGSKGTLWSYFPSKEQLFAAVLDRAAGAYRAELAEILDPCGILRTTLEHASLSLLRKVTSPQAVALHRLIIAEGRRFPELSRIFFDLAPNNTRQLLARFLQGAMDRGQLRVADPVDAARIFTALTMSGTHQQLLMGRIDAPDESRMVPEAAFATDIFLRAYAPPAASSGHSA